MTYLFVATHTGSGAKTLCRGLAASPAVAVRPGRHVYAHPEDLASLAAGDRRAAVHVARLTHNYQFSSPALYGLGEFVYVVREPGPVMAHLTGKEGYTWDGAAKYYRYRLRRLCEMARKTPGAVLMTFDDVASGRGVRHLDERLVLRGAADLFESGPETAADPGPLQACYERYLRDLRVRLRSP